VTGLSYKIETPISFRVTLPGGFADHESFDARGHLNPWSIMRVEELVRGFSFWMPTTDNEGNFFMDIERFGCLMFTVSATVEIQPQAYDESTEKRPIDVTAQVSYIGRTSFKYKTGMNFPGYDKPLVTIQTQTVFCDLETRRPKAPDDWWREKYAPLLPESGEPLRIPSLTLPDDCDVFEEKFRILPSLTDPYMHCNWSYFIRYFMDALFCHHIRLYGYSDNGDPYRLVKKVMVNYKGEASAGDEVVVKFWPASTCKDSFYFLMLKDTSVICECSIEFYPVRI